MSDVRGAGTLRPVRFHSDRFPGSPAFDTAASHAMLRRVAAGASPESLRLYRPDDVVLFSSLDVRRPGFERAVEIARESGFDVAIRLAGGHAAAFLEESMAFAWAIRDENARLGIRARFERMSDWIAGALRRLDLDARVGELAGEYCPGEFSINIGGRVKVMGVGQRVIRAGAHVGGVLTVGQSDRLREVLIPVYAALDLEFRPETAGGIADFDPRLSVEDVIEAMRSEGLDRGLEFENAPLDRETLGVAGELESMHDVTPSLERSTGGRGLQAVGGKTLLQADQRAADRGGQGGDSSDG